jgi:vacuolar-type H+-ATPase subunit E/Vma4
MKQKARADRFNDAQGLITEGKNIIEELREELQSWLDNMPENLQGGSKADELQTAIDELESVIMSLEEVEGVSVDFPGR